MIIIAHRGNTKGRNPKKENSLSYINAALNQKYQVEVDVWYDKKKWWLGHNEPKYKIDIIWLSTTPSLWVHCKNLAAAEQLAIKHINAGHCPHFFWHETDTVTLTSHGILWTFPRRPLTSMSIAVLPELSNYTDREFSKCLGICTDLCDQYKKEFNVYGRKNIRTD